MKKKIFEIMISVNRLHSKFFTAQMEDWVVDHKICQRKNTKRPMIERKARVKAIKNRMRHYIPFNI